MRDWIDSFMEYTEGIVSPREFRLWAAITAVGGALERRVWVNTGRSQLFPNLFTLLVGPPGVGKTQAINPVKELWYETKALKVAPSSVTKAALIDAIAKAGTTRLNGSAQLLEYHSLLVASSEFGVLVPKHDMEFMSALNDIYDNPRAYSEERRTNNLKIDIIHPQLTILAGTQPGYLGYLMPEEAWTMGFASRIIMVYGGVAPRVSLFAHMDPRESLRQDLVKTLTAFTDIYGLFLWERDAQESLTEWHLAGCHPVPQHSRLQHYIARRTLHVIKLAMISAVSSSGTLTITLEDVDRAKEWLLATERTMPDVFRAMVGRSDNQLMDDLHQFVMRTYNKSGQKPVGETYLYEFLKDKLPAEKIAGVIEAVEKSGAIERQAGLKTYVPRGRDMGVKE